MQFSGFQHVRWPWHSCGTVIIVLGTQTAHSLTWTCVPTVYIRIFIIPKGNPKPLAVALSCNCGSSLEADLPSLTIALPILAASGKQLLAGFFHSAEHFHSWSMFQYIAIFYFFLLLNTTRSVFPLLVDIWVISIFWTSWVMLGKLFCGCCAFSWFHLG